MVRDFLRGAPESVALAATWYRASFLDKRGCRGRQPRGLFSPNIRCGDAFEDTSSNIDNFCNLYFLFYKEETREVGAIFCLLACCLFVTELGKY